MSNSQQCDKTDGGVAAPGKKGTRVDGVFSGILCLVFIAGAVVVASLWIKFAEAKKEAEEQLRKCHEQEQAREVSNLLEALYLPPELMDMDAIYRRGARDMRLRMFRRQGREKVVDMSNLGNYPEHWDNYKEVPLHYADTEKAGIGSFERAFYRRTYNSLRTLAYEMTDKRGMGLYLSEHPDLYQNHVRPLLFRLLEQLPAEDKLSAASVLLAAGESSLEFDDAIKHLYTNPEFSDPGRSEFLRGMEGTSYADRIGQLEEMRAELEQLWAGKTPELQAEAIFKGDESRQDPYGDPLPPGALARLGSKRFRGPFGEIKYLDFSRDGQVIRQAVNSGKHYVTTVFDAKTGQVVNEFSQDKDYRINGPVLPKGNRFVKMGDRSYGESISVENIDTGEELLKLPNYNEDYHLGLAELDAEGRTLAVLRFRNSTPTFEVWDVDKATRLFIDRLNAIGTVSYSSRALTFTRGGEYMVALLNDHSVAVWRRSDWKRLFRTSRIDITGAQLHVCENDDAIYVSDREEIVGFNLTTGEKLGELKGQFCIVSEDLDRVAVKDGNAGTDGQTVYSLPAFKKIVDVPGLGRPEAVRGNQLAMYFPKESVIRVLDIPAKSVIAELPAGYYPQKILLSPAGKTLVEANGRFGSYLSVWDLKAQSRLPTCMGHFSNVAEILVDSSNRDIYSFSETEVLHWRREEQRISLESELRFPERLRGGTSALLPSGNKCLITRWGPGRPSPIEIRDAATWDLCATIATEGLSRDRRKARRFNPESNILAVGYADGSITLQDVDTGTITQTFFAGDEVLGMEFSADGKWLACWTGDKVFAWQLEAKRNLVIPPIYEHNQSVKDLAFTALGSKLVILNSRREAGGYTEIIDTASGKTSVKFWIDADARVLAISPDDQLLAIGFGDGRVQVHAMQTGKQLVVYRGHRNGVSALTFTPNGQTLLSGGVDGLILEWKLPQTKESAP
ncbi:MAG: hypothetical protein RRC34_04250 [Lentisphaeria bacterium]|nr:hypothetical protein [Lentisphaeria bacterium]